jgi:hypothetical protein
MGSNPTSGVEFAMGEPGLLLMLRLNNLITTYKTFVAEWKPTEALKTQRQTELLVLIVARIN